MDNKNEDMKQVIMNQSAMYYFRATPFSEHSELNYDGKLSDSFFFDNMFSNSGNCEKYVEQIKDSLYKRKHKTILLTGNQGCGKTTFVHYLSKKCEKCEFLFFDFDKDTSHPTLAEYIERLSNYLHTLMLDDLAEGNHVNQEFYNLYQTNKKLVKEKINAENRVGNFFELFKNVFLLKKNKELSYDDFILEINNLYFNQILSLIVIWHLAKQIHQKKEIKRIIICLDNLDVLVNQEIIERFFKEYFRFVRNVDAFINNVSNEYIRNSRITYNTLFAFVLNCRQHTWARVKKDYTHDNPVNHINILPIDLTDAFIKQDILAKREQYIKTNKKFFGLFVDEVENARSVLNDLDVSGRNRHTIYDLFNDDYRQCIITVEDILREDPTVLEEYTKQKKVLPHGSQGLRGIIYYAMFAKFKREGVFRNIGVLDIDRDYPLVSNSRLLLNYLNYNTYRTKNCVPFSKIVADFKGIIPKEDIDNCLVAMFEQGFKSSWNELIAFDEINNEEIDTCENTEIFITVAGHEYLDFVATHFEFFNTRITEKRYYPASALFATSGLNTYRKKELVFQFHDSQYQFVYNFEETIFRVMQIVDHCCENMTKFYEESMKSHYPDKTSYLYSPYVYGESDVLHGERIIHTHIRYIDNFRLYVLRNKTFDSVMKRKLNQILTRFIGEYIGIGKRNPTVLTDKSTKDLFPAFEKRIREIIASSYNDYEAIDK